MSQLYSAEFARRVDRLLPPGYRERIITLLVEVAEEKDKEIAAKDEEIEALKKQLADMEAAQVTAAAVKQQRMDLAKGLESRIDQVASQIKEQFIGGLRAAKAELITVGFTGHAVDVVEAKIRFEEARQSRSPS